MGSEYHTLILSNDKMNFGILFSLKLLLLTIIIFGIEVEPFKTKSKTNMLQLSFSFRQDEKFHLLKWITSC